MFYLRLLLIIYRIKSINVGYSRGFILFTTLECFKMQMVINLAPIALSNKKVNLYTYPRLTFLKKNATENAYKSISEPQDLNIFWGGMPPHPPSGSRLRRARSEVCMATTVHPQKYKEFSSLTQSEKFKLKAIKGTQRFSFLEELVQESNYCLEISKARGRLKVSG